MPYLEREVEAHIVNVSSLFGLIGVPGQASYCASKFAVYGFIESLRAELEAGTSPIRITSVHPGGINTNTARNARFRQGAFGITNLEEMIELFKKVAITSPERAAKAIVNGIKRKYKRLLIGNDAMISSFIQRLMPVAYQKLLMRVLPHQ